MANVGHWANSSGSSVNYSITLDRHSSQGNAGVYSDNLVEVASLGVPA